jgi:hypothetical protein
MADDACDGGRRADWVGALEPDPAGPGQRLEARLPARLPPIARPTLARLPPIACQTLARLREANSRADSHREYPATITSTDRTGSCMGGLV